MTSGSPEERVTMLVDTALRGLPGMLDDRAGLFVFTRRPSGPEGRSFRYTCITLIGLTAAARARHPVPLPLDRLVRGVADRQQGIENWGELGLALWCLTDYHERVTSSHQQILERLQVRADTLGRLNTTELGWLLTGLAKTARVSNEADRVRTQAELVYAALRANYSEETGLFCYGGRGADAMRRWLRRRLGFFDNQVYGIYAGATYYDAFGSEEALAMADACAAQICRLQGPCGQWAWHYNTRSGRTVDRYPVYSVHQDGMAPMALGLLRRVAGRKYDQEVARSVQWLFGENELGRNLVDREAGIIWRSIRRRPPYGRLIHLFKLLSLGGLEGVSAGVASVVNAPSRLEVDLECRPYHLGWLLLAFAADALS